MATRGPGHTAASGVVERFNCTLQSIVQALMVDSHLPKNMWDLAVSAAVHAYNCTPHKAIGFEIPLRKFALHIHCHTEQLRSRKW